MTARLIVDDPRGMVEFLREAFGASGRFAPDVPTVLRIGDANLMVSGTGPRAATSSLFYLYVPDVDATYERALRCGASSVEEPADMPYGDRRAMVTDPYGNDWQIATHLERRRE